MESQSCVNKLFEVEIGLFQKKVNTIAVEAWVFHHQVISSRGFQCVKKLIVAETKWLPFCRRQIQRHFLEWKCLSCDQNFTRFCFLGSNWQFFSIGSDNGLSPVRRWPISLRYEALDLNELKGPLSFTRGIHLHPLNVGKWKKNIFLILRVSVKTVWF